VAGFAAKAFSSDDRREEAAFPLIQLTKALRIALEQVGGSLAD
jgi:hypothetical protein